MAKEVSSGGGKCVGMICQWLNSTRVQGNTEKESAEDLATVADTLKSMVTQFKNNK